MIIKFLVSLLPFFVFLFLASKQSFQMLQQNWYNDDNRYLKWIFKNSTKVWFHFDFLFLSFFLFFLLDSLVGMALFIIFYTIMSLILLHQAKKDQNKKPLAFTSRVKRLCGTTYLLYLIPVVLFSCFFDGNRFLWCYLLLGAMGYLNYFIVAFANFLNRPIEAWIKRGFKKKALKKLKSMSQLKVIGITGSYGKTSSKNILSDILNIKYNALPTPKNFNTPMGLILTINQHLDKFTDLFIAEMGAFKKGEIKELCDLVHPTYGILTKIGTAHLESFGSQENIQQGKFELIESLPEDGIGVLNGDDPLQRSYALKNNCQILWIGIDSKEVDVQAKNIKLGPSGTTFDVVFKGDKTSYPFSTKLLGKANVYNILAAIALGKALGLEIKQLQAGVKKVATIEHRLELKKYGPVTIIDDAYNSNPVGSKMALEVLSMMPGKKIVVTPGMIELADQEYELNKEFGRMIADVCDEVILIGQNQTKPIQDGLKEKKYNAKKIHILNDVKEAFPLMLTLREEATYVLLENDLPDIFNER